MGAGGEGGGRALHRGRQRVNHAPPRQTLGGEESDMSADNPRGAKAPAPLEWGELLAQYGCGPIQFRGTADALSERHLLLDNITDPAEVDARERYEALARSVRDVLSQRWVRTEQTYERENPKRVYYLSMEFLIGRSLANNIMNLRLDPIVRRVVEEERLDWLGLLEEEPDAGLGNGGPGRLSPGLIQARAALALPPLGSWLRYADGMFRQAIAYGWQPGRPGHSLRRPG